MNAKSRSGSRAATESNRSGPTLAFPVVSVSALSKLAEWHSAFVSTSQGGQSCSERKRGADGSTIDPDCGLVLEPTVEVSVGRGSTADADEPQPARVQAASATFESQGGGQ